MGLRVLPMAGASYSVKLTRGVLHLPDDSDYQLWAQEWGVDVGTLQQADAAAALGDYRLLRAVLARLVE